MVNEELLHAFRCYISTDAALLTAGAAADARLRREAAAAKNRYLDLFVAFTRARDDVADARDDDHAAGAD